MVPAFSEVIVTMKPGAYTKTPVQTQFGWHVILLEETRKVEPPTLESVKPELMAALQREALAKYVGSLQEKAKLDLNPELIKQSPPETAPEAK
jgi:peptidyl-prolyl cis-trans isomerase C